VHVCIPTRDVTTNREGEGRPLMWDSDTTTYKTRGLGSVSRLDRSREWYLGALNFV
jgi:hypothetical protein